MKLENCIWQPNKATLAGKYYCSKLLLKPITSCPNKGANISMTMGTVLTGQTRLARTVMVTLPVNRF